MDFAEAAGCPPSEPHSEVYIPYILVHSASQQDLKHTEQINATVKTHFGSEKWEEIKSAFEALSEPNFKTIMTVDFLILDKQSTKDRKVVIMAKSMESETSEGQRAHPNPTGSDDLIRYNVWKRYRVPFEEAFTIQCAFEGFSNPEPAEKYFEEVVEKKVAHEIEEAEEESDDSDDSKDSEYYEHNEK